MTLIKSTNEKGKRIVVAVKKILAHRLYQNFFSLSLLQVTNYLLPIITLPYLIRVLGSENFGKISICQAFFSFLLVVTDYGFSLTATRDVSRSKSDTVELSKIFSSVFTCKILLSCLVAIITITFLKFWPGVQQEKVLYFFGFFLILGQVLMPTWFFQGLEKMKYLTYLNFISKFLFTVLIFIFISKKEHYSFVLLYYSAGNIISGIISLVIIKRTFSIDYNRPPWKIIWKELNSGFPIFLSVFSINSYSNVNILLLGVFANDAVVGLYSIAEKFLQVMKQLLSILFQSIYPKVCELALINFESVKLFLRKVGFIFLVSISLVSSILFILADWISAFIIGIKSYYLYLLIKMTCLISVIICINIPFYQVLLVYDLKKRYSFVLITGSLISVVLNLLLAHSFSAVGTILAILTTELFISCGMIFFTELERDSIYSLRK